MTTTRPRPAHAIVLWAVLLLSAAVVLLSGCPRRGAVTQTPPPAPGATTGDMPGPDAGTGGTELSGTLTILVPCGQLGPYMDAKPLFLDKHPDLTIDQRIENINVLRTKIREGKLPEADVFMDMGDTVAKELAKAGKLADDTVVGYAQNYLALVVPADNAAGIGKLEDLGKPEVQAVALATPEENSNGAYAVEALRNAGLWDRLNGANKTVIVDQPAQLKGLVGRKKVDAAFIYEPCAHEVPKGEKNPKPREGIEKARMVGKVPQELYTPFYCTAGVLTGAPNPEAARAFVQFLQSDECNEIWQNWYFGPGERQGTGEGGEGRETATAGTTPTSSPGG